MHQDVVHVKLPSANLLAIRRRRAASFSFLLPPPGIWVFMVELIVTSVALCCAFVEKPRFCLARRRDDPEVIQWLIVRLYWTTIKLTLLFFRTWGEVLKCCSASWNPFWNEVEVPFSKHQFNHLAFPQKMSFESHFRSILIKIQLIPTLFHSVSGNIALIWC